MILLRCACGKSLRIPDEYAGKRVRCPACRNALVVSTDAAADRPGVPNTPKPAARSQDDEAASFLLTQTAPPSPPRENPVPLEPGAAPRKSHDSDDDDSSPYSLAEPAHAPQAESAESPEKRRPSRKKSGLPTPVDTSSSFREYAYLLLVLTLIPLAFSLLRQDTGDIEERLIRTLKNAPPDVQSRVQQIMETNQGNANDIFAALPDARIEGALLPRHSWMHWLYAVVAAASFFGLLLLVFSRRSVHPLELLLVGLFTATIGIAFLLAVQYLAIWTQGAWLRGRSFVVVIFYVLKFIGFSYRSALDPDSNFVLSFLGFTFGVGLCEELCKALPLLCLFRRNRGLTWRAACLWGLATGVGFGVSEGITYSADFYNGIHSGGIYLVRFLSCVALHAMWSAAVGILLYHRRELYQGDLEWTEFTLALLRVLAVAMILHGLYDTLLKKNLNGWALLVALASFAWLAWLIESSRGEEPETTTLASAFGE